MNTDIFDYPLPEELIARVPAARRDHSRLMVINRASGEILHLRFDDLPDLLPAGTTLFRNNATVLKARLRANRTSGGKVECLLLKPAPAIPRLSSQVAQATQTGQAAHQTAQATQGTNWDFLCLLKPGKRLRPGEVFFREGHFSAEVIEKHPDGENRVRFTPLAGQQSVTEIASLAGELPLPPYIEQARAQDAAGCAKNADNTENVDNTEAAKSKNATGTTDNANAVAGESAAGGADNAADCATARAAGCTTTAATTDTTAAAIAATTGIPTAATADAADAADRTSDNAAAVAANGGDAERYQTVYANPERTVAAAAPTAGLHFTPELLETLRARGIPAFDLTLHVGLDTFRPIATDTVQAHQIHRELYEIPAQTQHALEPAPGKVRLAVGTTTLRSIEHYFRNRNSGAENRDNTDNNGGTDKGGTNNGGSNNASDNGAGDNNGAAWISEADIFLYPPAQFFGADALITNFHLPRSTLLCLVSAFLTPGSTDGIERMKAIYAEAIARRYRFFSYGDAMLIL